MIKPLSIISAFCLSTKNTFNTEATAFIFNITCFLSEEVTVVEAEAKVESEAKVKAEATAKGKPIRKLKVKNERTKYGHKIVLVDAIEQYPLIWDKSGK